MSAILNFARHLGTILLGYIKYSGLVQLIMCYFSKSHEEFDMRSVPF